MYNTSTEAVSKMLEQFSMYQILKAMVIMAGKETVQELVNDVPEN